ncbi:MAG: porin [Gammaproteobacteria bacterium]|nr:porin [Gammaproteobacteria bacterium]
MTVHPSRHKVLAASALALLVSVPMSHSSAVVMSISGHVNRTIVMVAQDGSAYDDVEHVNANSSEARFHFKGSEDLDSGLTAGANLKFGRPDNSPHHHMRVSLSGSFGKLSLGQASHPDDAAQYGTLGGVRYDSPALGAVEFSLNQWDTGQGIAAGYTGDKNVAGTISVSAGYTGDENLSGTVSASGAFGATAWSQIDAEDNTGFSDESHGSVAYHLAKDVRPSTPVISFVSLDHGDSLGVYVSMKDVRPSTPVVSFEDFDHGGGALEFQSW